MTFYDLKQKSAKENKGSSFRVYYVRENELGGETFGHAIIRAKNSTEAKEFFLDNTDGIIEVLLAETLKQGEIKGVTDFDLPVMTDEEIEDLRDPNEPTVDKFNPYSGIRPA